MEYPQDVPTSDWPNWGEAQYGLLSRQTPITTPGLNIDLYAVDLQRIEVLKGPQCTLFGASSQAGTVRLITNKPDLREFSAGGELGMSSTKSGGISYTSEGFVNIPIVEDTFALRLTGYSSCDGGSIYKALKQTTQAITAFEKAVDLNPSLFGSWCVLADEPDYSMRQEAKKHVAWLSSLPPELVFVSSLIYQKKFHRAESLCRHFLKTNPHQPEAMRLLAELATKF